METPVNPVRRALLERRLSVGSWIQIGHPAVAEVLADSGFSWLAVDCEHTDIDLTATANLFRAMGGRPVVPMVRVRENSTLAIRQALDIGAMGVIVPLVDTADDAARAVAAARYPPDGVRGFAYMRANRHGQAFAEYVGTANSEVAVVVMIESRVAVDSVDAILAVPGVDGVFIGPYDLSGSYGIPGQTDSAPVRSACQRVLAACGRAGKSAGLHVVRPTAAAVAQAIEQGFTFLAVGVDVVFLAESAAAARAAAVARS
jgi:2-keto-3-deoxy-L-rhamnonate aldolase RhmA